MPTGFWANSDEHPPITSTPSTITSAGISAAVRHWRVLSCDAAKIAIASAALSTPNSLYVTGACGDGRRAGGTGTKLRAVVEIVSIVDVGAAFGVMVAGTNATPTPFGKAPPPTTAALNVIAPAKPFVPGVAVMVYIAGCPAITVAVDVGTLNA